MSNTEGSSELFIEKMGEFEVWRLCGFPFSILCLEFPLIYRSQLASGCHCIVLLILNITPRFLYLSVFLWVRHLGSQVNKENVTSLHFPFSSVNMLPCEVFISGPT